VAVILKTACTGASGSSFVLSLQIISAFFNGLTWPCDKIIFHRELADLGVKAL
jgi:hypothetical protein